MQNIFFLFLVSLPKKIPFLEFRLILHTVRNHISQIKSPRKKFMV